MTWSMAETGDPDPNPETVEVPLRDVPEGAHLRLRTTWYVKRSGRTVEGIRTGRRFDLPAEHTVKVYAEHFTPTPERAE